MIPQLIERIAKCENAIAEIDEGIKQLGRNLSELRQQLQVEREPPPTLSAPMMDCGGTGGSGLDKRMPRY